MSTTPGDTHAQYLLNLARAIASVATTRVSVLAMDSPASRGSARKVQAIFT